MDDSSSLTSLGGAREVDARGGGPESVASGAVGEAVKKKNYPMKKKNKQTWKSIKQYWFCRTQGS